MPASRADLFIRLEELGIQHETHEHKAVFTVEESRDVKAHMPGGHSKNLFLKDKAGELALVVALADRTIDLKSLGKHLGAKARYSFGKPELMEEVLGVTPGSVTPFALINDQECRVAKVVLDAGFFDFEKVWFHPLENTATTGIRPDDLEAFVHSCGHAPMKLNLGDFNRDLSA